MLTRTWASRPRSTPRTRIPRPRTRDINVKFFTGLHHTPYIIFSLLMLCDCFYVCVLFHVLTIFCQFMNNWICYCCSSSVCSQIVCEPLELRLSCCPSHSLMSWLILLDFSSRTILRTFLCAGVEVDCGSKDISEDRSPLVCVAVVGSRVVVLVAADASESSVVQLVAAADDSGSPPRAIISSVIYVLSKIKYVFCSTVPQDNCCQL